MGTDLEKARRKRARFNLTPMQDEMIDALIAAERDDAVSEARQAEWRLMQEKAVLTVERDSLKDIIGRIHQALGESEHSDDDSLPAVVSEVYDAMKQLRERCNSLKDAHGPEGSCHKRRIELTRERDTLKEQLRRLNCFRCGEPIYAENGDVHGRKA